LATLTLDEAVPLLVRKPFDGALCQRNSFLQQTNDGPGTEPPTSNEAGANLNVRPLGTQEGRAGNGPPRPCCGAASRSSSARRRPAPASGRRRPPRPPVRRRRRRRPPS